jgi:hypothetical protein
MFGILVIAVILFCIFAIGRKIQSPAQTGHHTSKTMWLNVILVYCVCAYVMPWVYTPLWQRNEMIAFGLLSTASAIVGVIWQYKYGRRIRLGAAFAGGLFGSHLSLLYHLILCYTLLDNFEDTNLGFHLMYVMLSPIALVVGLLSGCLAWLSVVGMFRICTSHRGEARSILK